MKHGSKSYLKEDLQVTSEEESQEKDLTLRGSGILSD
jgi:hypothetical protein